MSIKRNSKLNVEADKSALWFSVPHTNHQPTLFLLGHT